LRIENGELKRQKAEGRKQKAEGRRENENKSDEKNTRQSFSPCKKRLTHLQILPSAFLILHSQFSILNLIWSGFPLQVLARLRLVPGYPLQSLTRRRSASPKK
jgi:hypothetical protein